MLKKISIAILVLVAALFSYAAITPSEFRLEREVKINATPEAIFPYVNNPRKMDSWNPWIKLDPNIKSTYRGPESGVGAVATWDGNKEVGAGTATVVESVPHSLVRTKLEYQRPFQNSSLVEFTLKSDGNQTTVSWAINGHKPFFGKIFCLLMNMEKKVGGTFEKGLADLKSLAESPAK